MSPPDSLLPAPDDPGAAAELVRRTAMLLLDNVERVIVGKRDAATLIAVALLAEGHVLLDDVPGVGKTMLAKAVARSLGGSFRRVQFTPDLLPSDVTGVNIYDQSTGSFRFVPGPLMAHIVLADEINRATPRTQSCLLESMEEWQVTVDGDTRALPRPFLVLATQNPVEQEGTFPLPEAQLDRFLLTVTQGYPDLAGEEEILLRFERSNPLDTLEAVLTPEAMLAAQAACRRVHVSDAVRRYCVTLVRTTRETAGVRLGASPRATLRFFRAAQAFAAIRGRDYVLPDDFKALAVPVLAHRLVLETETRLRGGSAAEVVGTLLERVAVPAD